MALILDMNSSNGNRLGESCWRDRGPKPLKEYVKSQPVSVRRLMCTTGVNGLIDRSSLESRTRIFQWGVNPCLRVLHRSPVSKNDWPAAYDTAFPSTIRNRRFLTRRSPVYGVGSQGACSPGNPHQIMAFFQPMHSLYSVIFVCTPLRPRPSSTLSTNE